MVALVVALLSAPPAGYAGRVVAVTGEVTLTRNDEHSPLARGTYLLAGDVVETGSDGALRTLMRDKSVLALPGRSSIKIAAYDVEPTTKRRRARLTVLAGRLWALVTKAVHPDASYEVATDNAVAGVRGTELVFDVDAGGDSQVTVITGEVDLASSDHRETLGARERGRVGAGEIALNSTTEAVIAELREGVRPEQELDTAKADKRLAAARAKTQDDDGATAAGLTDEQQVERDEPGTGDAVFEDLDPDASERGFDDTPTGWFDPSTMGRVRVTVEVRP